MASTVAMEFLMRLRIDEYIDDDFIDSSLDRIRRDGDGTTISLDDATTPDVEDYAIFTLTLSSGTGSINLAALPHNHGGVTITKNATGKKIRAWIFWTPAANANNILITDGASNGYQPLGAFDYIIAPDGREGAYFKAAAADVASGARVLDVTGTGAQQVHCCIVWG